MENKTLMDAMIEKLIQERNEKIDALNKESQSLNARRADIYAQYELQIQNIKKQFSQR